MFSASPLSSSISPLSLLSLLSLSSLSLHPVFIAGRLPPCVATAMLWDIQLDHFVAAVPERRAQL